jgi:hypothetical protein
VPPRRMQRSSSKLGQLCHAASLPSLRSRTVATASYDSLRSDAPRPNRGDHLRESLRGFLEENAQARVEAKQEVARKGGMAVLDRAANWVHAKPRRKRRVPPQGIPQQAVEKILSDRPDTDEFFNTDLGDQTLPKGSFLEIRRSVPVGSILLSVVHDSA